MNPTTSSKAKVSRSLSLKESLPLNLSASQTSSYPGSSPTSPSRASTPLLPFLSAPFPGLCNTAESRLSYGVYPSPPTAKITKSRVSARMSSPLSEYPNRSTPSPSTDFAAGTNTFDKSGVPNGDKCYMKGQVQPTKFVLPFSVSQSGSIKESLDPKNLSHTPRHHLVDVQACSVPCKSQSDQGLFCFFIIS